VNGDTRWRRLRLIGIALAPILAVTVASTSHAQPPLAGAEGSSDAVAGQGTWCNADRITAPGVGSVGVAAPYPSTITVDGAGNTTTQVTVQLDDFSHTWPRDLDVMLVGPTGQNLVLMGDTGGFVPVADADLTISDGADGPIPDDGRLAAGTYRPTDADTGDRWTPPAPPESVGTDLATFNGDDPNGTWALYVADEGSDDVGSIGRWCLTVATDDVAEATVTTLTTSPNPSAPGENVTLSANVTSGGVPVTDGTVTFSQAGTPLATVDVTDGEARFDAGPDLWDRSLMTARFDGTNDLASSSRSVVHTVATVADGMWCSNEPITTPSTGTDGAAAPFPSEITVAGAGASTTEVTVQLGDLNHRNVEDLDVLLVSPTGRSLVLMSDVAENTFVGGLGLTFTDEAAERIPFFFIATGAYRPTNWDDDLDTWMPPAPPDSGATKLAVFNGDDPNGTWSLYVNDDESSSAGWIGGWCLTIETEDPAAAATVTTLESSPNPSLPGEAVTFTAGVSSGGQPVTEGTVTFTRGSTPLGQAAVIDGTATFTTSLPRGGHLVTARFDGAGALAPSSRSIDHRATTLAGGTWCNSEPIAVPDFGAASLYPSPITIGGAGTTTSEVTVRLGSVVHGSVGDINVMLVSPTGRRLILMSDVGDDEEKVSGADLTFSDRAPRGLPVDDDVSTGTYRPTNVGRGDVLPAPAPTDSGATTLATFNGTNPNGTWRLFVADDDGGLSGWIGGGWCLDIAVDDHDPQARPTVSPAPNAAGWNRGDVTVTWNWRDAESGIDPAHCRNGTTFRGEGRRTLTATCRDRVGHDTSATRIVRVDRTPPTVTITSPTRRRYAQGTLVGAEYACGDGLSGIVQCGGTVADGSGIDTSTLGRHRFSATGVDRAGNRRTATVTYTVVTPPTCAGQRATIVGTAGADVLTGTRRADVIVGGGGQDTIAGGDGRDTICAGAGADALIGGGGGDRLDGGSGTDVCRGGPGVDQAIACELTLAVP
jgi:subtilisin-like proprotein convertase family protein